MALVPFCLAGRLKRGKAFMVVCENCSLIRTKILKRSKAPEEKAEQV